MPTFGTLKLDKETTYTTSGIQQITMPVETTSSSSRSVIDNIAQKRKYANVNTSAETLKIIAETISQRLQHYTCEASTG